jgi:hypothetical protein
MLLLGLLLSLAMGSKPRLPPNTAPTPIPTTPETLPARTERLIKIQVMSLKDFNGEQDLRFRHIVAGVEKVVNLKGFEEMVKAHTYKGKSLFVDTSDSPSQVFEKITSKDWLLEYRIERLTSNKTIGYTLPSVTWIAFNSKFWYKLEDAEIAANICHEYGGHKFGRYSHSMKWNEARDYSAPYGLGTICKNLYRRVMK